MQSARAFSSEPMGAAMPGSALGRGLLAVRQLRMTPEQLSAMGRPPVDPAAAAQSFNERVNMAQMASANNGPMTDPALLAQAREVYGKEKRYAQMGLREDGSRIMRPAVMREPPPNVDPRKMKAMTDSLAKLKARAAAGL